MRRNVTDDEHEQLSMDPVLAHTMLGTVAAAKGAIDTVLAHKLDGAAGEALLLIAVRRLTILGEQLRHVALGVPIPPESEVDELA